MGIALPDLAISAVDKQLDAFALSRVPCRSDSLGLAGMMGGVALRALPEDSPVAVSRYYVNWFLHCKTPNRGRAGL